jgi:hypothetical protein
VYSLEKTRSRLFIYVKIEILSYNQDRKRKQSLTTIRTEKKVTLPIPRWENN